MHSINNYIFEIINNSESIAIQNILMAIPDRHIALAIFTMEQNEKDRFLSYLSLVKRNRIIDEIKFMRNINVNSKIILQAKQLILSRLNNDKRQYLNKGYIRKKRR